MPGKKIHQNFFQFDRDESRSMSDLQKQMAVYEEAIKKIKEKNLKLEQTLLNKQTHSGLRPSHYQSYSAGLLPPVRPHKTQDLSPSNMRVI